MTSPHDVACPNCGEKHDASGRYTSPANGKRDERPFTRDQISTALNHAADDISGLVPEDEYPAFRDMVKGMLKSGKLEIAKDKTLRKAELSGTVTGTARASARASAPRSPPQKRVC